jgi:hypothetical protein
MGKGATGPDALPRVLSGVFSKGIHAMHRNMRHSSAATSNRAFQSG